MKSWEREEGKAQVNLLKQDGLDVKLKYLPP